MRKLPADFEELKQDYIRIGSIILNDHSIPPQLVYGLDETSVQFVSQKSRTKCRKGEKKVRVAGIGEDKACITVPLCIKESGEVLPPQYIFTGKTNRCHPAQAPPSGYFTHTHSHWQTPFTLIEFLERIVLADRDRVVAERNLPETQHCLVKLDLHYSHFDEDVLNFMSTHRMMPLFVPAGCTDQLQECDTVLNKPFKQGVKAAFRDHLHHAFTEHVNAGHEPNLWAPKLTTGALKPFIVTFVEAGIACVKKDAFAETIKNAFNRDGHFQVMRSAEMYEASLQAVVPAVAGPLEPESEEDEEVAYVSDAEIDENEL
jgi:hypothetical protein